MELMILHNIVLLLKINIWQIVSAMQMIVLLPLEREKKNHIQIGIFFKLIKWQIQILINSSSHAGDGGFLCQRAIEEDNYRGASNPVFPIGTRERETGHRRPDQRGAKEILTLGNLNSVGLVSSRNRHVNKLPSWLWYTGLETADNSSQKVVLWKIASVSHGNIQEMQTLRF